MSGWKEEREKQCAVCNKPFMTKWPRQQFCADCQKTRRSNLYHQKSKKHAETRSAALEEIAEISSRQKTRSLHEVFKKPDPLWEIVFSVPFHKKASKNNRFHPHAKGIYVDGGVKDYEMAIGLIMNRALSSVRQEGQIKQGKLWVSFFVQKPNHKIDAINIIDTVCDVLKKVTGVDDNWFCIGQLDWEIKKNDPQIFIKISQEITKDMRACSHCGNIYAVEDFYVSKPPNAAGGTHRACKRCAKTIRGHASVNRNKQEEMKL